MTAYDLYAMTVVPDLAAKALTMRLAWEEAGRQARLRGSEPSIDPEVCQCHTRWQQALQQAQKAFGEAYYGGAQQAELLN